MLECGILKSCSNHVDLKHLLSVSGVRHCVLLKYEESTNGLIDIMFCFRWRAWISEPCKFPSIVYITGKSRWQSTMFDFQKMTCLNIRNPNSACDAMQENHLEKSGGHLGVIFSDDSAQDLFPNGIASESNRLCPPSRSEAAVSKTCTLMRTWEGNAKLGNVRLSQAFAFFEWSSPLCLAHVWRIHH